MKTKSLNVLILLLSIFTLGCSHEHHKHSHMNKKFLDPNIDVDKYVKSFEDENRDVFKNRQEILNSLDIKKGDTVADIGAGTGFFLSSLDKMVGAQGKVYAVEISKGFVDLMSKKVVSEKLKSVEVIQSELNSTMLPSVSLDTALLVDVYHHLDEPTVMLNDFKRILKKNGNLVIVDFDKVPGVSRKWVLNHLRLDKRGYIDEITKAGFKFMGEKKIPFKENFLLVFKKI